MPPVEKRSRISRAFEGFVCSLLIWFICDHLGLIELVPPLRGSVSLALLMALGGALLGLTRGLSVLRFGIGGFFCLWLLVAYTPLAAYLVRPLKVEDPLQAADAIVVLQAGIQADDDFGSSTLERIVHGLELIQQEDAPRLIITETPPSRDSGSHLRAASTLMKNLKVECPVFAVGPVTNTHDEAVQVAQLARNQGWSKILLVTSPTHSRRACLTFRKTRLQVISTPCRESSYDFENLASGDPSARLRAFAEAMREIIGLRTYKSRGWA